MEGIPKNHSSGSSKHKNADINRIIRLCFVGAMSVVDF